MARPKPRIDTNSLGEVQDEVLSVTHQLENVPDLLEEVGGIEEVETILENTEAMIATIRTYISTITKETKDED